MPTDEKQAKRFTIGVDFDGVLHSYVSGWKGACEFPDPPVPGAIAWLREMLNEFDVHILSARARNGEKAIAAMRRYLLASGLTHSELVRITISATKEPCLIYIDDRGYRFTGLNFPNARTIHKLTPWMKGLTAEQLLEEDRPPCDVNCS